MFQIKAHKKLLVFNMYVHNALFQLYLFKKCIIIFSDIKSLQC